MRRGAHLCATRKDENMSAFFEYLRNITYYLMFATVVGMIAPTGKYHKFVSLVMGFILLAIMLAPLARWSGEIPVTQWFSGVVPQYAMPGDSAETNYTAWRNNYLRTAFEAQLETQLTNLLVQSNFTVYFAEFDYSDDFSRITSVRVAVSRAAEEENRRVPFIRIEPVQISRPDAEADCPTATAAKNLISEFYNIDMAHIYVEVRER